MDSSQTIANINDTIETIIFDPKTNVKEKVELSTRKIKRHQRDTVLQLLKKEYGCLLDDEGPP